MSWSALSQTSEPIQKALVIEEENESLDGFDFYSLENISTSKLRDSPHFVSSSAMSIIMTNMISFEEQVSTIAQTLEELMKSIKEREALRDTQIAFMINKMGNAFGSNCEDESLKPKQCHYDKVESFVKGEEN